jgi:hypothetical protein
LFYNDFAFDPNDSKYLAADCKTPLRVRRTVFPNPSCSISSENQTKKTTTRAVGSSATRLLLRLSQALRSAVR